MPRIRTGFRYDKHAGSEEIGCIQLVTPTFFPRGAWIPQPSDWRARIQASVKYDLSVGEGRRVWESCIAQAASLAASPATISLPSSGERGPRYGDPRLVQPRLGQATFRTAVLDAYGRACAITGEHSLPALQAAHIRSYVQDGPH